MITPLAQARAEHSARVSELLRANNREVERRRDAEGVLRQIHAAFNNKAIPMSHVASMVEAWTRRADERISNEVKHGEGAE